jgi:hypothetical protein
MTIVHRLMLLALVPAFVLGAVSAGLCAGGRGGWQLFTEMWREASHP